MGNRDNPQPVYLNAVYDRVWEAHQNGPTKDFINRLANSGMRLYKLSDSFHFRDKTFPKPWNLVIVIGRCGSEFLIRIRMKFDPHFLR